MTQYSRRGFLAAVSVLVAASVVVVEVPFFRTYTAQDVLEGYDVLREDILQADLSDLEVSKLLQSVCQDCVQRDWEERFGANLGLFIREHLEQRPSREHLYVRIFSEITQSKRFSNIKIYHNHCARDLIEMVNIVHMRGNEKEKHWWKELEGPILDWPRREKSDRARKA